MKNPHATLSRVSFICELIGLSTMGCFILLTVLSMFLNNNPMGIVGAFMYFFCLVTSTIGICGWVYIRNKRIAADADDVKGERSARIHAFVSAIPLFLSVLIVFVYIGLLILGFGMD